MESMEWFDDRALDDDTYYHNVLGYDHCSFGMEILYLLNWVEERKFKKIIAYITE